MSDKPTKLAHIGICVSNLERSMRFYDEGLGFKLDHLCEALPPFESHVELDKLYMRGAIYRFDGCIVELSEFQEPGFKGPAERRPMNQLGFTHFSLEVDDINAVIDRIVKYGGKLIPQTRLAVAKKGEFVFCTDPDGVRIQLWQMASDFRP
jgi:predicted enzyme related to lactoylglutathione lyase